MATHPENSLAGIAAAIADGVDGVEFDVRALADGTLVLVHDDTLARTTGIDRRVDAVTVDQVRMLALRGPGGAQTPERVPTLSEALAAFRAGDVYPVVDICAPRLVDGIAEAVRRSGLADVCRLTGPDARELAALKRHLHSAVATVSVQQREGVDGLRRAVDLAAGLGLDGVNPDYRLVDAALMREAERRNLVVTTWTVNAPAAARALAALGVASITSNAPAEILRAL